MSDSDSKDSITNSSSLSGKKKRNKNGNKMLRLVNNQNKNYKNILHQVFLNCNNYIQLIVYKKIVHKLIEN